MQLYHCMALHFLVSRMQAGRPKIILIVFSKMVASQLYKSLIICRRLGSEDMPRSVNVKNCDTEIKYNFNTYGVVQQTPQ